MLVVIKIVVLFLGSDELVWVIEGDLGYYVVCCVMLGKEGCESVWGGVRAGRVRRVFCV